MSIKKAVAMLEQFNGIVEQATEQELADACAISDRTGAYTCPHTGVALAALFKLVKKGVISSSEKVVVISTAHGLKFSGFKLQYHEKQMEDVVSYHSNLPVQASPDIDTVRKIIDDKLIS